MRIVFALGLAAFFIWLWTVLFPSQETIITRRFEKLARAASVRASDGYLARMAGARRVGDYLAKTVEISIDLPNRQQHMTMTREEIVEDMMAVHSIGGLSVKFPDISVTVAAEGTSAQADVTVEARGSGDQDTFIEEMRFTLRKTGGQWLITKVQTIRALS